MHLIIPYNKLKLVLIPQEKIFLPAYKGSTLRGAFGNTFKRVVCISKKTECPQCIIKEKCIYSYVFETLPPTDTSFMRKYEKAPHPFIIEPPFERTQLYSSDDKIDFNLILIGRAIDYLPYFIYTFDELGRIGIGKYRGKYELKEVLSVESPQSHDEKTKPIYSSDTKTLTPFDSMQLSINTERTDSTIANSFLVTFNFLTPTRLVYKGKLVFELEFHIIIRNLLRRIALLYYFHSEGDPTLINFKELIEKAEHIKLKETNLKWYDWQRYSKRQDVKMKLGGFIGAITFEGNFSEFMPFIRAGEVLHLGKGTGFGLGKYDVEIH